MLRVWTARPPEPIPTARRARVIAARIAARDAGTPVTRTTQPSWGKAYVPLPRWRV